MVGKSRAGFIACSLSFVLLSVLRASAADNADKSDPRYPFRTDFANANLPWYMPKPGEFPPHHSDRRISGELISADFIHRTGQFRTSKTGELVDFTMPPYGSVVYLNAEAELRDVPLGTFFLFFLNQDSKGGFTRLATMEDQYTMDMGHSFSYRLDELKLSEGKLLTTKQSISKKQPDLGKKELLVTDQTRVWKGDKQIKLSDLVVGDELLYNLTGKIAQSPGHCTDIYVGAETHKATTDKQRLAHAAFEKMRGLPGWIDHIEGNTLTVTLFSGDPGTFKQTYMSDFAVGKDKVMRCVVVNDELRSWNPPVDGEKSDLLEIKNGPVNCYGTCGVQLKFTVKYMLEGFRKDRIVRIVAPGWTAQNPPYGESLMNYGYGALKDAELVELTPKEYPRQFPFRTDYGNDNLPWYQLKAGEVLPRFSEHVVFGDLVKADTATHSGQFRTERTGDLVDFSLIPQVSAVRHLGADGDLSDLPLGARCRFNLYQDEKGAFTKASLVSDEFSYLALNSVSYRIEAMKLDEGKLYVARQIPAVKNYNGDMERPPDIGRTVLRVSDDNRIWKGSQQIKLTDLAVGDELMMNLTSEQPGAPSHCTDIWVGADTFKLVTSQREKKHPAAKK